MRYSIITIGTRGDTQPFVALGKQLKRKGHHVRIAAFSNFKDYIEGAGLEYAKLAGDPAELMRQLIGEQVSSFEYFRNLDKLIPPIKKEFLKDIENACEGADAILYTVLGSVAWHVAERDHIPCFRVFFNPLDPTSEFPAMTAPSLPLPLYNRFTFQCGDWLWSNATRKYFNDWRKDMGLYEIKPFQFPYRTLHGKTIPTLYPYSPLVAPKPHDWDNERYLTGYWIDDIPEGWKPDEALLSFLNSGEKPVYFGFGSAVGGDFHKLLSIILESVKATGVRALLSSGWGNLSGADLPDTVFQVGSVPHEWLFHQTAAVVHHGGCGTTAAGLRAGVPNVVVPFGGDQPYWGRQVYRLGAGPKPIWRKKISAKNLTRAIDECMNNPSIRANAQEIGRRLREENGVENAIRIIEEKTLQ